MMLYTTNQSQNHKNTASMRLISMIFIQV